MSGYPTVDELELALRGGNGISVILEGQTAMHDPWFFGKWFDDRARRLTFFPQDGWDKVIVAVAELRQRCPGTDVYGVIDRDFATTEELDSGLADDGVLRMPRYTLENYLLDPVCWAGVFEFIFERRPSAPDGWDDPERCDEKIHQCYRDCLDLSAHNRVTKFGCDSYPAAAAQTAENDRTYRTHPASLAGVVVEQKLAQWGGALNAGEDFAELYRVAKDRLLTADFSVWQQEISGKYVLDELHRRFPKLSGGQFPLEHYLGLYMRRCPDPPSDLKTLLDRIEAAASP